jgi:hypothetical protein
LAIETVAEPGADCGTPPADELLPDRDVALPPTAVPPEPLVLPVVAVRVPWLDELPVTTPGAGSSGVAATTVPVISGCSVHR